ncbi:MAG: patatin family protein [Chloroflexi bacterium]|nr:patatin family protein [Chloroflexota bacterium]MBM4450320.1 patatin family protein [Chloroflexota bacterium]
MRLFKHKIPKIGIALGSGAARGLAHIGVLKALREAKIPVHMVAGTSMVAMIGACFANSGDISAVEETALKTGWKEIARLVDPKLSTIRKGLIYGERIGKLLRSLVGDARFEDLKMPFACVATDINTGQQVVITNGVVAEAVRASISIPGIFVPTTIGDRCLVDGGLTNPIPTEAVKDMGAEFVIAVNVLIDPQRSKRAAPSREVDSPVPIPNIFNTLIQSLYIMEYEIMKPRILDADVTISPQVSNIEAFDFHKSEEAILAGYKAAKDALPRLQHLLGKL